MKMIIGLFVCTMVLLKNTDCKPALDVDKFPCHKYLDIISNWSYGYRGILNFPVVEDMIPKLPEVMKNGSVVLTFNRSINTLDVPEGDYSLQRRSPDYKEYRIFIKFQSQLLRLRKGDIFSLDISVHHQRWMKGNIGLSAIQFGNFHCPDLVKKEVCSLYIRMIDNTPSGEFRAQIRIPANNTMKGWKMKIAFTNELIVLDVPNAIIKPATRNVRVFNIENRDYNSFVKKFSTFTLEFMAHFDRNRFEKRDVKVEFIHFGAFQCRTPTAEVENDF